MVPVPTTLIDVLQDADAQVVESWWTALTSEARDDVARLCDERLDACFFGVVADDGTHVVPTVRGGRFLPSDDAWGFDEWGPSYFDHLIAHPELVLVYDPTARAFHTGCTRHPSAIECWASGSVPATFTCPFGSADCFMRPLLGRRVQRIRSGVS